jgi:hypothetical protein
MSMMSVPVHFTRISALLLAVAPAGLFAQWEPYLSPGVPKTADGKPDLTAPTPKTPDGKPDLSGIWLYTRPPAPAAPKEAAAKEIAAAPPATPAAPANREIIPLSVRQSQFWNLGASFPDGLPFQPWAAELHRQRVAENSRDNPDAHCLPLGLMQLHTHGQPRKIVQTPGVIVIVYEANSGLRQIFTDGRSLPTDPQPWWYGYSVGKWEGDTLVVETAGFRDLGWLDVEGSPLTTSGKLIERFHRVDFGHLDIDITIDDLKAYTKPWTVTVHQRIMPDTELIEFVCQENEKDAPHLAGK